MDAANWVRDVLIIVIGAFIVYVVIQTFCETYSGFCEYGWTLMAAYIFGAALYLKYGLSRKS